MNKNETKTEAMSEKVQSVGLFLNKYSKQIAFCMMVCVLLSTTAFATTGGGTAESLWNEVTNLIGTWVTRFGGVVMFVGIVMFGLGWQNNDASQKNQGVGTFVGGAIIAAAGAMIDRFFG